MKKLNGVVLGISLALNGVHLQEVKAANIEMKFKGYQASGSGYLRFNNLALKSLGKNLILPENGEKRIYLSNLAKLPKINLEFNFVLKDTARFGYGETTINFKKKEDKDAEFIFEFQKGLGSLVGINYSDSQPLSIGTYHDDFGADFEGNFSTTWTGNSFYNQGVGEVKRYELQDKFYWNEEKQEWVFDRELVLIEIGQGYVSGEYEGEIDFLTKKPLAMTPTPEPITWLGSAAALYFGTLFKGKFAPKSKKV
ncbi:PEP-CTERM sorting domain-containing protein [Gloeothece verrucosa]|uniref:PEP-CTERM protein-sorting domain-containing protein n=1 Tax=Gloeothece verrucosa (strain PCC 7822) TaxID=497965 RepID=E0UCY8_GLOV7|nr:PEP-CTERM sorting domain-containing protein [Gloeothece verrucosa]ADN16453.1 hypothetical protein Cyan7822_4543 [Gloeothece verrucosa PCC 7822]